MDGFPHSTLNPHFSAKSHVAQPALTLEHLSQVATFSYLSHSCFVLFFSLGAGVVAHIVMLGDQCHWGCDPQGVFGQMVCAIHLMPKSRQIIAVLQDGPRSLQVSVVWMGLIFVYDLTALKQPVNVLFSLQLSHWKPSLIELPLAW